MATSAYQVGLSTGAASIAYAPETTWGTVPTDGFKRLRVTSASMTTNKTRARPNEIDDTWGVSSNSTNERLVGGALGFVMSLGNPDDWLAAVMCSAWEADAPTTGEDRLRDGKVFQSFTIETKLASNLFFRYPGSYPTSFSMRIQRGQFLGGDINVLSKDTVEATSAADASVTAAGTGRVFSTIGGVKDITLGGSALGRIINLNFTAQRQGADRQMTIDSVAASGISPGLFEARAEGEFYFANMDLYNAFKNETQQAFAFRLSDGADLGYTFKLLAPDVDAAEPPLQDKTRPLTARFAFMSNPDASGYHLEVIRNLA